MGLGMNGMFQAQIVTENPCSFLFSESKVTEMVPVTDIRPHIGYGIELGTLVTCEGLVPTAPTTHSTAKKQKSVTKKQKPAISDALTFGNTHEDVGGERSHRWCVFIRGDNIHELYTIHLYFDIQKVVVCVF